MRPLNNICMGCKYSGEIKEIRDREYIECKAADSKDCPLNKNRKEA